MPRIVVGGKTINLSNNEFLAKGGEGEVYAKGDTAYKIYTDSSKMISSGKIKELSVLTSDNVISPQDVIINKNSMW